MGRTVNKSYKEELGTWKQFSLDSEMQKEKHGVCNFAMDILDPNFLLEKLNVVFESLKCDTKLKVTFSVLLKKRRRWKLSVFFYSHENNTMLERSKPAVTAENSSKLKNLMNKTDVIDLCTRDRPIIKWNLIKLTNVTIPTALREEVPLRFKYTVLPNPLVKNHSFNQSTIEESTQKLWNDKFSHQTLPLHLHGNGRLEVQISKYFNLFLEKTGGISNFSGVCMEDIATVREVLQADFVPRNWHFIQIPDWRTCEEKNKETFFYCATITLQ